MGRVVHGHDPRRQTGGDSCSAIGVANRRPPPLPSPFASAAHHPRRARIPSPTRPRPSQQFSEGGAGRVEMWRGSSGWACPFAGASASRCLTSPAMLRLHIPLIEPRRTGDVPPLRHKLPARGPCATGPCHGARCRRKAPPRTLLPRSPTVRKGHSCYGSEAGSMIPHLRKCGIIGGGRQSARCRRALRPAGRCRFSHGQCAPHTCPRQCLTLIGARHRSGATAA